MFTKKGLTYTFAGIVFLITGIIMVAGDVSAGWVFLILSSFWLVMSRTTEQEELVSDSRDD